MRRYCGFIRPYPGALGHQVVRCVESAGYSIFQGSAIAAGVSDERCARWIERSALELLVVPYHLHRGGRGRVLDGIGVLLHLPADYLPAAHRFFMPVGRFSWGASFARRYRQLALERPDLAACLLVAHESELSLPDCSERLRRCHDGPLPPLAIEPAVRGWATTAPPRPGQHASTPRDMRLPLESSQLSLLPPSDPDRVLSLSSRPSSLPPSSGSWLSQSSRRSSLPPSSGTVLSASAAQSARRGETPTQSVRKGIEAARENFRRATEIGAQARLDFERGRKGRG